MATIFNVTVDSLFFNAPSTLTGIYLNAAPGVTTIILSGNSSIQVSGNDATKIILGDSVANRIQGMGGNDLLLVNDGNDLMIGGAGNDYIDGGAGLDTTRNEDATSAVTVGLLARTATEGLRGFDTLVSVEACSAQVRRHAEIGEHQSGKQTRLCLRSRRQGQDYRRHHGRQSFRRIGRRHEPRRR